MLAPSAGELSREVEHEIHRFGRRHAATPRRRAAWPNSQSAARRTASMAS
jgi:hypothetical protein